MIHVELLSSSVSEIVKTQFILMKFTTNNCKVLKLGCIYENCIIILKIIKIYRKIHGMYLYFVYIHCSNKIAIKSNITVMLQSTVPSTLDQFFYLKLIKFLMG